MSFEALKAAQGVYDWAKEKSFQGHDPHDLLEAPVLKFLPFRAIARSKYPAIALTQIGRRSGFDLHSALRIPEVSNPKGDALFLQGLLQLRERIDPDWSGVALALIERILSAQNQGGWGYPFAWRSRTHYIPKHSPTIVTTAFCAHALLDAYSFFPSELITHAVSRAVSFIQLDLPRIESDNGVVFGYAPNDPQIVFNASLLGATVLVRWGYAQSDEQLIALGARCGDFVRSHQSSSGRWAYGLEEHQTWSDSFHTAYVVEALRSIGHLSNSRACLDSAELGFQYFVRSFVRDSGSISYYDTGAGPFDAHSAATAILLLQRFGAVTEAERCAAFATENLQLTNGAFGYQRERDKLNTNTYVRWSNAWMFRALADVADKQ